MITPRFICFIVEILYVTLSLFSTRIDKTHYIVLLNITPYNLSGGNCHTNESEVLAYDNGVHRPAKEMARQDS